MIIQWYPGHMTKSMRMIEQNIKLVDAVLYILDARAVNSSINPSFEKLLEGKKRLYIINKSDLSDQNVNILWENYFKQQKQQSITITGTNKSFSKLIIKKLNELLQDKIQKYKQKGVILPIRAMVLGVPNSGKSTIINTLCGNKRAVTGNKAGVTRGKQWVKIGKGIELLDTPGTLWSAFKNQEIARHLAYIGSIKEDILDIEELAQNLLIELKEIYPQLLKQKYDIDIDKNGLEMLTQICRKKGCLNKGGEDLNRGAKAVIDDFKKARIGKISLERPNNA